MPYDRPTDIPTTFGLAWNDVTITGLGVRLAFMNEQRYAQGAWHDDDGFAWPDSWHARWTMSGHANDDGGSMRIYDGRCPVRTLAWLPVRDDFIVWELSSENPSTVAEGSFRGVDALRRALQHTACECEGV